MVEIVRQADDVVAVCKEHFKRIKSRLAHSGLDETGRTLELQNRNPVKMLTSGPEERSETPIEAGGKIRHEQRVHWWNDYGNTFCVFGHYSIPDGEPRGNGSAFCVDFGIGKRWTERRKGTTSNFSWRLAALRFPERVVVFDDGERMEPA